MYVATALSISMFFKHEHGSGLWSGCSQIGGVVEFSRPLKIALKIFYIGEKLNWRSKLIGNLKKEKYLLKQKCILREQLFFDIY